MSETTAKVLVFEPCRHDCAGLEAYGTIEYMFDKGIRRSSIWSASLADDITERIAEMGYDPKYDWLAIVGATVPVTLVLVQLLSLYGQVRVLFYSASERIYVPRTLSTGEPYGTGHNARGTAPAVHAGA